ncbi:hypothetical protein J3R82DRAFT_8214 [Butyriboletus roseoflavus]|nr:hypothetical protein J3R82DRAFT_8214 [Butyriboletus roseoflavus]
MRYLKGTTIIWVIEWTFVIFLNTADCELLFCLIPLLPTVGAISVVMVLRVYAMWNQSKWILWLLLFIYVPQVIFSLIVAGVYNTNTYISVTIVQVTNFSFCDLSSNTTTFMLAVYANLIPRFVLGAMLLILAGTQTLKQSVNMYKATKQWQPNRYMERLVRDGMIYFLVYVSISFPPLFRSHFSPPSCSQVFTNKLTRVGYLFSELPGTCFSTFLLLSRPGPQGAALGCSSWACCLT